MAELILKMLPYINKYGLINLKPSNEPLDTREIDNQNGFIFWSTYLLILKLFGADPSGFRGLDGKETFADTVVKWSASEGVPNRPANTELCSHDEVWSLLSSSHFYDKSIAAAIFLAGMNSGFKYQNKPGEYGLRTVFDRFIGFAAHAYMCAEMYPIRIWDQLLWSIMMLLNAFFPDGTSGLILAWQSSMVCDSSSMATKPMKLVNEIFKFVVKRKWPGAMGSVFKEYYGSEHPYCEAMWKKV